MPCYIKKPDLYAPVYYDLKLLVYASIDLYLLYSLPVF